MTQPYTQRLHQLEMQLLPVAVRTLVEGEAVLTRMTSDQVPNGCCIGRQGQERNRERDHDYGSVGVHS